MGIQVSPTYTVIAQTFLHWRLFEFGSIGWLAVISVLLPWCLQLEAKLKLLAAG